MKVKQACRRDRPGGEPQCKGCAPANRGQKESSVCFSLISIAKLSLCFEFCKACAVFFEKMPLNFDFSEGRTRARVPPGWPRRRRGIAVGKRTGRQSGTGVKNAAPSGENAEQNRNTPAGRFISSPLFSYRCCRNVCCAVLSRRHARLSPARALSRQPVSVFCLHSFTRMPHCVVIEGVEGEGLWYFKFTCVHRARMRSEQSVGTRGWSYFLAYGSGFGPFHRGAAIEWGA